MKSWRVALVLAYQRHVHADEIRLAQRVVERHVLDLGFFLLNAARVAKIYRLLNRVYVFTILISRVVAEDIHVESSALLDHGQADTAGADNRDGFAGNFIAQEG